MSKPTATEQIEALLTSRALELAESVVGRVSSTSDYLAVFSVTTSDVLRYVAAHGVPESSYRSAPDTWDGRYCHRERGTWWVYRQERGSRFSKQGPFEARRQALAAVAVDILHTSGTGIDFDRDPSDASRGTGGSGILKFSQPGVESQSARRDNPPRIDERPPATRPSLRMRIGGVAMVVVAFLTMIAEIRYFTAHGTPDATGGVYANIGILLLVALPWAAIAAGALQIVSGQMIHVYAPRFSAESAGRRFCISFGVIILLLAVSALAAKLA
jgi:hypothetical protein